MPTAPDGVGAPSRRGGGDGAPPGPRAQPLLSEALRGHGALLRDARGERFVDELAPRDVVARAMATRMREQGAEHLWLDATPLPAFGQRFPTIAAALARAGLDPATEWLPIAPAAHYLIGGVVTDLDGATALPGLWAAGEVACTGVHGANRLASNSLLEGMVFAARVVEAIARGKEGPEATGALGAVEGEPLRVPPAPAGLADGEPPPMAKRREGLQRAMSAHVGVVRDAESLARAGAAADVLAWPEAPDRESWELGNLVQVGRALALAASVREETRGCHTRTDFPETSPALAHRLVLS